MLVKSIMTNQYKYTSVTITDLHLLTIQFCYNKDANRELFSKQEVRCQLAYYRHNVPILIPLFMSIVISSFGVYIFYKLILWQAVWQYSNWRLIFDLIPTRISHITLLDEQVLICFCLLIN